MGHAIQILTSVSKHPRHIQLLSSDQIIQNICEKIILPNMQAREDDEELFEDEPLEFIRKDLEGSDADTRRRAASELARGMTTYFEAQLTPLFLNYITSCLQQYAQNPSNWKMKDTAVHTFMAIAMKGTMTQHGVSQINQNVNIQEFYAKHCQSDFTANTNPMVLVGQIKFLIVFRNQLNVFDHLATLLLTLMSHQNTLVHTYAAICLEKYMALKNQK